MRKILLSTLLFFVMVSPVYNTFSNSAFADDTEETTGVVIAEDVYSFKLNLKVPQVIDNSSSRGYRKYKAQTIKGFLYILWMDDGSFRIDFSGLENKNFKVRGVNVTYQGSEVGDVLYSRFNYIGDNNKNSFTTPCIAFYLELQPSYALGGATEDNSFYLLLSGSGKSAVYKKFGCRITKTLSGYAAGTQGCGCYDYGHKSPTRDASICGASTEVNDVVATYGKWSATFKTRCFCQ